jgi:hypothetical protein
MHIYSSSLKLYLLFLFRYRPDCYNFSVRRQEVAAMNTIVEFESVLEGDVIRVPEEYRGVVGRSVRVIVLSGEEPVSEDGMKSVNALLGIIPNDFELDEMRLERIMGTQPSKC